MAVSVLPPLGKLSKGRANKICIMWRPKAIFWICVICIKFSLPPLLFLSSRSRRLENIKPKHSSFSCWFVTFVHRFLILGTSFPCIKCEKGNLRKVGCITSCLTELDSIRKCCNKRKFVLFPSLQPSKVSIIIHLLIKYKEKKKKGKYKQRKERKPTLFSFDREAHEIYSVSIFWSFAQSSS